MASPCAMIERRRSSRVSVRIPVKISSRSDQGDSFDASAEAVAVSRCGALLRVSSALALGARFEVLNGLSQESREFRIVRVTAPKTGGFFEWGVEILYPSFNFWGVEFPDER